MLVKFLAPTPYKPTADDSRRCYGQLLLRPGVIEREVEVEKIDADGTVIKVPGIRKECGPMETYFRKGATPDLRDEVARGFIAAGVAERYCGEAIRYVSKAEALQDVERIPL